MRGSGRVRGAHLAQMVVEMVTDTLLVRVRSAQSMGAKIAGALRISVLPVVLIFSESMIFQ